MKNKLYKSLLSCVATFINIGLLAVCSANDDYVAKKNLDNYNQVNILGELGKNRWVSQNQTPTSREEFSQFIEFITDYIHEGKNLDNLQEIIFDKWNIQVDIEVSQVRVNTDKLLGLILYLPSYPQGIPMIFAINEKQQVQDVFIPSEIDYIRKFKFLSQVTVNFNDLPDIVYIDSMCGAHTCFYNLNIIEWNGKEFVDLIEGDLVLPYSNYLIRLGQIIAISAGIASVGAGPQRAYTEIWKWNGETYKKTDEIFGPPIARVHLLHDADAQLEEGNLTSAIDLYRKTLDEDYPINKFVEESNYKKEAIKAYATFKLMVVYAVKGDVSEVKKYMAQLKANHIENTEGYLFVRFGEAFWDNYSHTNDVSSACQGVISQAKHITDINNVIEVGYENSYDLTKHICKYTKISQ